jgi:hypothetical protein
LTRDNIGSKIPPTPMAALPSIPDAGPTPQAGSALSDYIQPNLGHGLRIWWAFYWRNTLISVVLAFMLGMAIQPLLNAGTVSYRPLSLILQYGSYIVSYAVALFVMHYILRKNFRRFRIGLVSNRDAKLASPLKPTFKRTLRVWWTYTWRTIVYLAILSVAANVPVGFVMGAVAVIYPPLANVFAEFVRFVMAGAVGLFVIYSNILDEDFADFRVSLLPRQPVGVVSASPTSLPPAIKDGPANAT